MSIRIVCPNCHTSYNAAEDQSGHTIRCKKCQTIFRAGGTEEPADVAAVGEGEERREPAPGRPAPPVRGRLASAALSPSPRMIHREKEKEKEKERASRQISTAALFLIIGGVVGSLVIVTASIIVCIWLWTNPLKTSPAAKTPSRLIPLPARRGFAVQAPDDNANGAGERDGKEPAPPDPNAKSEEPPPPPRELEFLSPLSKDAEPPEPAEGPANPQLPPELVQKVKRATVYLRVTLPDGHVAQGSGFFGVEPNIVLTNAHVIGMLHPENRQPRKIEVIQNSGAEEERTLTALVLAVDRNADLAVLRVNAPDLPPPLKVRSARNLQETQQVYVFGFPYGAGLGKEITISQSSVSSLRRDKGVLTRVQVNGGMHPGNSGGPVVDTYGNVIGVAVSVLLFTQINFAVPGDQVYAILNGRVSGLSLGQPYRQGKQIKVPVTMQVLDPLARIREPALEVWTGDPSPPSRSPSTTQPPVLAGDSPHQRHALSPKKGTVPPSSKGQSPFSDARAEISLPPLPPGKVYWVQPKWVTSTGETAWATANVYALEPPVEQEAVQLVHKHQVGSRRPVVLNSWLNFKMPDRDGAEHTYAANAQTSLTETTEAVDAQELASVRLEYRAYNVEVRRDNQAPGASPSRARPNIKDLVANLRVDKQGNLVGHEVDLSRAPAESRTVLGHVHEELQQLLESLTIPLPNKRVAPGESWQAERTFPIATLGRFDTGTLNLSYTYAGVRKRDGRDEAVLDLKGQIRTFGNQGGRVEGRADGVAEVDLASGQVTQADMVLAFDVETNQLGRPARTGGKLTLRLRRTLATANAEN